MLTNVTKPLSRPDNNWFAARNICVEDALVNLVKLSCTRKKIVLQYLLINTEQYKGMEEENPKVSDHDHIYMLYKYIISIDS